MYSKMSFQALKKEDEDLTRIGSRANIDENARNEARIDSKDLLTPSGISI
jgi:hypothetical protein